MNFVPFVLDAEQLLGRLACLADRPERPVVTFFGLPEARVLRSLPAGMDYGAQVGSREDLDAAFDAGLRFGVLQTVEAGGHLGALTRARALDQADQLLAGGRMVFLSGISNAAELRWRWTPAMPAPCGTVFATTGNRRRTRATSRRSSTPGRTTPWSPTASASAGTRTATGSSATQL